MIAGRVEIGEPRRAPVTGLAVEPTRAGVGGTRGRLDVEPSPAPASDGELGELHEPAADPEALGLRRDRDPIEVEAAFRERHGSPRTVADELAIHVRENELVAALR